MTFLPEIFQNEIGQYYMAVAIMIFPVALIFRRAGFTPLWAALLFVPMFGYVICAAIMTFNKWPVFHIGEEKEGAK